MRPDLSLSSDDCSRCGNGTKCYCWVYVVPLMTPANPPFACACMGFTGCPECGRERGGYLDEPLDAPVYDPRGLTEWLKAH